MTPGSIRLRRATARANVAIGFACLAAQALFVRSYHHSLAVTVTGMIFPVLAVLSGLNYLRLTRGQAMNDRRPPGGAS